MKLKTKFQDEDLEIGEVVDLEINTHPAGHIVGRCTGRSGGEHTFYYDNLARFNEEWEDYEPKRHWFVDDRTYRADWCNEDEVTEEDKEIGNDFGTREEAEKAVEKLKALKRLKDKGFKFGGYGKDSIGFKLDEKYSEYTYNGYDEGVEMFLDSDVEHDLDLLFGGEE